MRLISEDGRDDVDEDGKLDFVRTSKEFSEIGVNQMQKRSLKIETMGNKKNTTEDVCVDIITSGLKSCKIGDNKSDDVTEMLTSLSLEEKKAQKTTSVTQEPQEVDELAEGQTTEDTNKKSGEPEEKEEDEEVKKTDMLVKLAAPSFDENEECEEKDPECSDGLGSRGPSFGIPVNHDPDNSYLAYNTNAPQMPANFPVYNNSLQQNSYTGSSAAGHMKKRTLDKQEACNPSYKYTCPQVTSADMAFLQMPCQYIQEPGMNNYNDLSGPKKVTNVFMKQMSGGTMVETDEQQQQQDDQHQKPGVDFFGDLNIPIPTEYVTDLMDDFHNQQQGLVMTTDPFSSTGAQTLTHGGLMAFGFDDAASDGYNSDASPAQEIQISPMPSPHSGTEAPNSSPPRQSWSPLSNSSLDSGVSSPLGDDQGNYSSQMMSPRQYHTGPQKAGNHSHVVNRSSPHHSMMSPPQQMMPSPQNMMASPHHMVSSPQQIRLPDFIAVSPLHPVQGRANYHKSAYQGTQLYQNNQLYQTSVPCSDGGDTFVDDYISRHLPDLNDALIVASEDLKEQAKKGCKKLQAPTTENIPNIAELNLTTHLNPGMTENKTVNLSNNFVQPNKFELENITKNLTQTSSAFVNRTTSGNRVMQPTYTSQVSYPEPRPPTVVHTKMTPVIPFSAQAPTNPPAGKIAIPQMRKTSASAIPVFILTPQVPRPRYTPIAPKEPAHPTEVTPAVGPNIPQTVICDPVRPQANKDGPKPGQPGPLEKTKKDKHLNIARRLVAEMSKPDLTYKDEDGDTYLHVAVCKADCFMVQALLERMVREGLIEMIDMQNGMGQTPIYLAVSTNHPEMVQLLIDHKADANLFAEFHLPTGAREKSAAIHCASQRGDKYLDTLKALLRSPDINLNQVNSDGHTALHCAILAHGRVDTDGKQLNSIPIIQALISAGADPNLQTQQSGKTALMYALESRDLELIEKTLHQVEPSKLTSYLKTQAFDGSTCYKIAELMKQNLHHGDQLRLSNCLKVAALSR